MRRYDFSMRRSPTHRADRPGRLRGGWLGLLGALVGLGLGGCGGDRSATYSTREDAPITAPHGRALAIPGAGQLYHGVFPGDDPAFPNASEDAISPDTVDSYEAAVGPSAAGIYFSYHWYQSRAFPLETATWIRDRGSLPFVRLMLRSSEKQGVAEPRSTPERIANAEFDVDLRTWGVSAANFGTPLAVEWGTEVNGSWFSWNGVWNGGADGGAARFRDAFRHIVRVISAAGAYNISWVFHVAAEDAPEEAWNRLEEYYPGDDAVDWVGVSIYGTASPLDEDWTDFGTALDAVSARFDAIAPDKPLLILEFGPSTGSAGGDSATWADLALSDLTAGRCPQVKGFSWWNEGWQDDSDPAHDTDMWVQTVPGLAAVFQARIGAAGVLVTPLLR